MKLKELKKLLSQLGWYFVRHGGKHDIWTDGDREIAIPRHNEINEYTAKAILKDAKGKRT